MKDFLRRHLSIPAQSEDVPVYPADYFSSLPELETESLLLRKLCRSDAADLFAYSSDPEVTRYVLWEPHRSISETRDYLRYMRQLYRQGAPSSWAIVLKDENRVIGTIGFMWYALENQSAEVGYSLSRAYWNRGYATQALSAVVRSAFQRLPLYRIEAQHDLRNPASGRVMEKCGFSREGVLRGRIVNKGEHIDIVLYAILKSDLPVES